MDDGRRRSLLISGVAAAVASVMMACVVVGWAAANRLVVSGQPSPEREVVSISLPDYIPGTSAQMPDVRGLEANDALVVLAESGLPAAVVTVEESPAAGPPGVVIAQTPVFGTVNPSLARIIISQPALVPAAVGREPSAVLAELQSLGARVAQVRVFVPGATVGTVVGIEPAEGSALTSEVTMTIADSPVARTFADLDRLTGSASLRTDLVHLGIAYPSTVSLSAPRSAASTSWDLAGTATVVTGSIAASDPMSSGFGADVSVTADGAQIARYSIFSTAPTEFSWPVSGVSTLTVTVTRTGNTSGGILLLGAEVLGSYSPTSNR